MKHETWRFSWPYFIDLKCLRSFKTTRFSSVRFLSLAVQLSCSQHCSPSLDRRSEELSVLRNKRKNTKTAAVVHEETFTWDHDKVSKHFHCYYEQQVCDNEHHILLFMECPFRKARENTFKNNSVIHEVQNAYLTSIFQTKLRKQFLNLNSCKKVVKPKYYNAFLGHHLVMLQDVLKWLFHLRGLALCGISVI